MVKIIVVRDSSGHLVAHVGSNDSYVPLSKELKVCASIVVSDVLLHMS